MSLQETVYPILANENFRYCICFLKNSGERMQATRLVIDVTHMPVQDAIRWVKDLHMPLGVSDEFLVAHKKEMAAIDQSRE